MTSARSHLDLAAENKMETKTEYVTKGKEPTAAVLAMGQLDFTGNVTPHTWYQHIVKKKNHRAGNDKVSTRTYPYLEAIVILGDICYWYRPREIRDEDTGHVIRRERRFRADKLQRSYDQYGDLFGLGKEQARAALKWLEAKGLITLELRTVPTKMGPIHNVLFIEPIPTEIAKLSRPASECQMTHPPLSNDPLPEPQLTDTYTEITTEITSKEPADADFFGSDGPPPQRQSVKAELPATSDPLVLAGHTAKRSNGRKSWTVTAEAGGADPWEGRPLMEWCALISVPYDTLPPSRKRLFASDLQRLAEEVHATPEQTGAAIRRITTDDRYSWLRTAGRPTHSGFANALQNALCGADERAPNVITAGYRTDAPGAI